MTGLDMQLRGVKSSIREAIGNVEKGLIIKIKGLERESLSVDERLTSVPTQEKQYRAIARPAGVEGEFVSFSDAKAGRGGNCEIGLCADSEDYRRSGCGRGACKPEEIVDFVVGVYVGRVYTRGDYSGNGYVGFESKEC